MSKQNWIGSETHRIRVNEIDQSKTATLPSLVNLMQEVAWNNSTNLKYSVYDLHEHGVTWVVYRMQIHIERYPSQQEEVTVQSWPSGIDRLYTYRDYKILDGNGQNILVATSAWLVMDIIKRELVAVPDFIRGGLDFGKDLERIPLEKVKLFPLDRIDCEYELNVSNYHMDVNGHVYNTHYIQWLLESMCGLEDVKHKKVSFIDIQFKGESRSGDNILAQSQGLESGNFSHQIINSGTDAELIRARSMWR